MARRRKPVKQIGVGAITEYSTVDTPATAVDFRMFKRQHKQSDLAGAGPDPEGRAQTGGTAGNLPDIEACMRRNPEWSPAQCEAAMAAASGLAATLEPDMAGDDATIKDPATATDSANEPMGLQVRGVRPAKGEEMELCIQNYLEQGLSREEAEQRCGGGIFGNRSARSRSVEPGSKPEGCDWIRSCVQSVMSEHGYDESRAHAICRAAYERRRLEGSMPAKQDEMPVDITVGEEAPTSLIDVPTTATEWPVERCIADCKETLACTDEQAIAICDKIRQEFGDMENPGQILIPDGMSTESLLQSAAIAAGVAQIGQQASAEGGKVIEFSGKNRWWRGTLARLGALVPKSSSERALRRVEKEIHDMHEAAKSKDQVIGYLWAINRTLMQAQGLDTSALDQIGQNMGVIGGPIGGPTSAAPASPSPAELMGALEGAADEGKRGKADGDMSVGVVDPAALALENDRLRRILSTYEGGAEAAAGTGEEPSAQPPPAVDADMVAAGTAPGLALVEPGKGVTRQKAVFPARRQSQPAGGPVAQPQTKRSSILRSDSGCCEIPVADRKAAGWNRL